MIEQYFKPGVRYLWNKPNDFMGPTNGAVVASVGAATNMTYDGLDGRREAIDPTLLLGGVGTLGITMKANITYDWLDYAPGRTAYTPIGGSDILTGYMSGCPIVRGTYNGAMSAFHVGTITGMHAVNQIVKQTFALNLPADATGFNPAGAWTHGEIQVKQMKLGGASAATEKIVALVTSAGTFYSILLFNVDDNAGKPGGQRWVNPTGLRYWCVGGIKQVPPLNRANLLILLS